jgi:hypothetical protein
LAVAGLSLHCLNCKTILKLAVGEKICLGAQRCRAYNRQANGQELSESGALGHNSTSSGIEVGSCEEANTHETAFTVLFSARIPA